MDGTRCSQVTRSASRTGRASIVATCKLNNVNPADYIANTLQAILNGHPQSRIEELMPWRFRRTSSLAA